MSPRQLRNAGRNAGSLRGQLVSNALVSIALPLSLAGAVVFFILNYHLQIIESSFARSQEALTRDIAGTDIRAQARNAAQQLDEFLIERITEAKAWATARVVVVDAARRAHERHRAEGLVGAPVEEIEARFHRRKSLGIAPAANTYLRQQLAASPFFADVSFTDRNGFNVALTNPTSGFVQSDETWWQNAWGRFLSVGDVEYDDSAGVWSVEISVRIEDPDTGEPLGIMNSVLAIEPVQHIAETRAGGDRFAGGRMSRSARGRTTGFSRFDGFRDDCGPPGTALRDSTADVPIGCQEAGRRSGSTISMRRSAASGKRWPRRAKNPKLWGPGCSRNAMTESRSRSLTQMSGTTEMPIPASTNPVSTPHPRASSAMLSSTPSSRARPSPNRRAYVPACGTTAG